MGSAAALISRLRKHPSAITVTEKCISCGKCARACPMQLHPAQFKGGIVKESDCLRCGKCVEVCPKKAVAF
ncbi:MAG: 4Fe-4S binding protein [Treponema sp.]|nr:4Fe-4S binding protein [Treponema sp.]